MPQSWHCSTAPGASDQHNWHPTGYRQCPHPKINSPGRDDARCPPNTHPSLSSYSQPWAGPRQAFLVTELNRPRTPSAADNAWRQTDRHPGEQWTKGCGMWPVAFKYSVEVGIKWGWGRVRGYLRRRPKLKKEAGAGCLRSEMRLLPSRREAESQVRAVSPGERLLAP